MKVTRVSLRQERRRVVAETSMFAKARTLNGKLVVTLIGPDHRYRVEMTRNELGSLVDFMDAEWSFSIKSKDDG